MGLAAPTAGLVLILLLLEARETLGGAHSLCLNLTVKAQTSSGQPWCETQGSVDGKPFLQCDSDSGKATPLGWLGEKVKDTKAWRDLPQTLEDVGRELRMVLPVIKVEKSLSRGPPILQAKMCCQIEAGQCTAASWEFSINRHTAVIDTKTMQWTVVDPGARGIKEQFESSRDLTEHLRKSSLGDCSLWLKEFLGHWGTMLEPTAPSSTTLNTIQSSSTNQWIAWILPTVCISCLTFSIFSIVLFLIQRNNGQGCKKGSVETQADVQSAAVSLEGKSVEDDLLSHNPWVIV